MPDDTRLGIRLDADAKGFTVEMRIADRELDKLSRRLGHAPGPARAAAVATDDLTRSTRSAGGSPAPARTDHQVAGPPVERRRPGPALHLLPAPRRGARRAGASRVRAKRLIGAARHWAAERPVDYELWEENVDVMRAWMVICDQWHLAPSGHPIRIDWPAVKVLLDAHRFGLGALVEGLRVEEREVAAELARQAEARS